MPKSTARRRKQPPRRPAPPAAREARSSLPSPVESVEEEPDTLVDQAEEDDDETEDAAVDGRVSRGFVRTATLRQGRVPYLLHDVIKARHEVAVAERELARLVRSARSHGATWEDIGTALGMTRQGAAKRFG
jgi:hypothetical protein